MMNLLAMFVLLIGLINGNKFGTESKFDITKQAEDKYTFVVKNKKKGTVTNFIAMKAGDAIVTIGSAQNVYYIFVWDGKTGGGGTKNWNEHIGAKKDGVENIIKGAGQHQYHRKNLLSEVLNNKGSVTELWIERAGEELEIPAVKKQKAYAEYKNLMDDDDNDYDHYAAEREYNNLLDDAYKYGRNNNYDYGSNGANDSVLLMFVGVSVTAMIFFCSVLCLCIGGVLGFVASTYVNDKGKRLYDSDANQIHSV